MKWLRNRSLCRTTDQVYDAIKQDAANDEVAKTLALAVGFACHPTLVYGDDGNMDRMLQRISDCPFTPCDSETALKMVQQWKSGQLHIDQAFGLIWGMQCDHFIKELLKVHEV